MKRKIHWPIFGLAIIAVPMVGWVLSIATGLSIAISITIVLAAFLINAAFTFYED